VIQPSLPLDFIELVLMLSGVDTRNRFDDLMSLATVSVDCRPHPITAVI
jgi:hypothetical protein